MNQSILLILPIILPIIAGIMVSLLHMEDRKTRNTFVAVVVIIETIISLLILTTMNGVTLDLFSIHEAVGFKLQVDTLSLAFGGLVSVLWVFATFYSFGYMEHVGKEVRFFTFFLIALGVSMGLAFSGTGWTLYLFYELLTFSTYPLLTHTGTPDVMAAGKKYLIYSLSGGACIFISIALFSFSAPGASFVLGGAFKEIGITAPSFAPLIFFIGFLGFGVKEALFPVHGWLPSAYVAATPVTALLHAVAVVKAGIFGMMRLTYYCFGADVLRGSWAQIAACVMAMITIIYGSTMALRTRHLKKRLAYSTVSQPSYIIFTAMMMSSQGLSSAVIYMIFHGMMKITLFLCCGSIIMKTNESDVRKLYGIGNNMPITMICFTIASFGLTGLFPTVGLIGKWYLGIAAFTAPYPLLGAAGIVAIMISAFLTALYLLPFCAKAFYTKKSNFEGNLEPPKSMGVPVIILSTMIVILGLMPGVIARFVNLLQF